jgi:hypothetical protein
MYRKPYRKALGFESLETRRLLAGNVSAVLSNNNTVLTLTGDSADNAVMVTNSSANVIQVVGLKTPGLTAGSSIATTIGGGSSKSYLGVTTIIFNFNGTGTNHSNGDDTVILTNLALTGSVTINGGDGDNFFGFGDFENINNAVYDPAASSKLGALTLGQGLTVNTGNGNSTVSAIWVTLNGAAGQNLGINGGQGTTTVSMNHIAVAHLANFNVATGSGTLDLTLNNFSANYLTADTTIGNDSITMTNSRVNFAITLTLDFGNDVVDLENVVAGSVWAALGQGANQFTGISDQINMATTIQSGAQVDSVTLNGYSTGSLSTALAGGGNILSFSNVTVAGAASIGAGLGTTNAADNVTIDHLSAASINMTAGSGDDTLSLTNISTPGAFNIDTGAGSDDVSIVGLSAASLWGMFQSGDDVVSVGNAAITGTAMFGGGPGNDTYNDEGNNTYGTLNKVNFEVTTSPPESQAFVGGAGTLNLGVSGSTTLNSVTNIGNTFVGNVTNPLTASS